MQVTKECRYGESIKTEKGTFKVLKHTPWVKIAGFPDSNISSTSSAVFSLPVISSCRWMRSLHWARYSFWMSLYSVITSTKRLDSAACCNEHKRARWHSQAWMPIQWLRLSGHYRDHTVCMYPILDAGAYIVTVFFREVEMTEYKQHLVYIDTCNWWRMLLILQSRNRSPRRKLFTMLSCLY